MSIILVAQLKSHPMTCILSGHIAHREEDTEGDAVMLVKEMNNLNNDMERPATAGWQHQMFSEYIVVYHRCIA